ncbi:MAG: outer membrane lipoprotein-sorting protein, partial [Candidatus Zixiibacteriota bacterium]
MRKKIWFLLLAGLTVMGVTVGAEEYTDADIKRLIHEVDTLYRSEASYAELEMEIITPHWQRTLAMDSWTEGMDKTFIRIKEPLKEKGVATLRIDNEMWNFLPKTNKVMKIPPSMMMSSWMGSDFTNDDLVKEFSLFED